MVAAASFGESHSFTADSPYLNIYIDSELQSLNVLHDTVKDINKRAKSFIASGHSMANLAKALANTCNFEDPGPLSEDPDFECIPFTPEEFSKREQERKKLDDKRRALGSDMLSVLHTFGEVLNEIAGAQVQMCRSLEIGLSQMETFTQHELNTALKLGKEATSVTDGAEKAFSNYVVKGKMVVQKEQQQATTITPESGGINLMEQTQVSGSNSNNTSSTGSKWSSRFDNWRNSNTTSSISDSAGVNSDMVSRSELLHTLHTVKFGMAKAELSRFELLMFVDSVKKRRDFELAEAALSNLLGIKAFFQRCGKLTEQLTPKFSNIQINQGSSRMKWQEQQAPWIRQHEVLRRLSDQCETDLQKECALNLTASNTSDTQTQALASPIQVEAEVQLWSLPQQLSSTTVYTRDPTPGVTIEGWLYHKNQSRLSLSSWIRRWFILESSSISYYKSADSLERVKVCDIVLCTVKDCPNVTEGPPTQWVRFAFELISPNAKPYLLQACGEEDKQCWISTIKECIERQFNKSNMNNNQQSTSQPQFSPSSRRFRIKPKWNPTGEGPVQASVIKRESSDFSSCTNPRILKISAENKMCADCGTKDPDWVSLNLGVLICIGCSGIHRSLGVHVSKVRSLKLDALSETEGLLVEAIGNSRSNRLYEAGIANQSGWKKPQENDERSVKENFIRSKYEWKGFIDDQENENMSREEVEERMSERLYEASKQADLMGILEAFAKGGKVSWTNPKDGNRTPLHVCSISSTSVVDSELVVEENSIKGDGNSNNKERKWQGLECAEFLLQNGAKLNAVDIDHQTPLDYAVCNSAKIEMIEYLSKKSI